MSLYAMSDLHLSHFNPKPMDIFDPVWENHTEKILSRWNETVSPNDTVLVPGDVSWAARLSEARQDLDFISGLNGKKIMLPGNHDYYWNSTQKLNEMYDNMFFLKNSFYDYNGIALCGTRGWLCPNDTKFTDHDMKIYQREAGRLERSLKMAADKGYKDFIVLLHFPPTNDKGEKSDFVDIIARYSPKKVVYGHLHGRDKYSNSLMGMVDGTEYILVSADYLQFKPTLIM